MPYADKASQRTAASRHYKANKIQIKQRAAAFTRQARKRNRDYLQQYLAKHPCIDCGEDDPIVLEFDHVRGKKVREVTRMANLGCSIETIESEISKCDVRCANCHRRRTHERRQRSSL